MAICWERAVLLAFHLCCLNFSAVFIVRVPFPFGVGAGCGIRLYRFLIFAFLSTSQHLVLKVSRFITVSRIYITVVMTNVIRNILD